MNSQDALRDLIGKLVWFFRRNDRGLNTGEAKAAIVIDVGDVLMDTLIILLIGEEEPKIVWSHDVELMEDWSVED